MTCDRLSMLTHVLYGVAGITAVVLLTAWGDITGPTALVVIMGLTGTSGAHSLAASTAPASLTQSLADQAAANRTMGGAG